ncbi:MAG: hypothetical protein U5N10_13545 [Gemmobacter sp.]|nr:hypothetical protein [Gemmobacter sp.]
MWNKLYRRHLLDGLTIRDICFEDAECLPRILQKCRRIVVIPEALYTYNKRFSVLTGTGFTDLEAGASIFHRLPDLAAPLSGCRKPKPAPGLEPAAALLCPCQSGQLPARGG